MMNEYTLDGQTIKQHLLRMAEHGNKPFTESLNPGIKNVLGLRIPELRRMAVRIARSDWEHYLHTADTFYMEERMLYGMVLGCICPDADVECYLRRVTSFVERINSWSVCDTFKMGGGKTFIAQNSTRLWQYFTQWLHASGQYEKRFGIVMLMRYFIDRQHVCALLDEYDCMDSGVWYGSSACTYASGVYYVKMALAWAVAECYIKYPAETTDYLKRSSMDDFTFNKTLQKITESYRVSDETKALIRRLKRK